VARTAQPEVVHLDTHVVCWLYEGRIDLLTAPARDALERAQIVASAIVDMELQLLHEIGRITQGPGEILSALGREIGLTVADSMFAAVVTAARDIRWTRDPFDRLVVADAELAGASLMSKDRLIRRHYPLALW
jgi:PIN domain nuclease of toxin-antitoxin system